VQKAKQYAGYDSNLLIYGETGTGKEVFAQSIHNQSKRKKGPFVSVNTASIAPSLLESELFGYVEGAFTGARKGGKLGLFELAHGGTIFLDEIGELSPDIQSRLLRVLQEKEIMRIGDDKIIPVDVRVICATNRDLSELVQKGGFRADLYYRINVLSLRLPPLRERGEDILELFKYFVQDLAAHEGKKITIEPDAMNLLMAYHWPGNIRELHNIAELLVCCESDNIKAAEIADIFKEKQTRVNAGNYITIPESDSLKVMETEIIKHFLSRYNPEEVCRRLRISRVTLWRKTNMHFNNETNELQ
jgi:transcriptional regulator with PAS, ATPase and Fis domain